MLSPSCSRIIFPGTSTFATLIVAKVLSTYFNEVLLQHSMLQKYFRQGKLLRNKSLDFFPKRH
jgi:hypothetical protein